MIDWEKIRKEFEEEDITLKALAEKYGLSPSTVRSRKNRENWQRNENSNVATRRNATDRRGGQRKNKNSVGNSGGPPKGSQNALTHGLFAKLLPDESKELMQELYASDPADIIWNNIIIQYTAIIRAQKIMYVEGPYDLSKEISGWSSSESGGSESFAIQYAWDKQANFMNAQARAMTTLSGLIKQFVAIADERDERRVKLAMMDTQMDLAKVQIEKVQAEAKIFEHRAAKLVINEKENAKVQGLIDIGRSIIGPIQVGEEDATVE